MGLRNVSAALALKKPSVAVYVQTADCWDAEKKLCCQFTQAQEGNDPCNQNFMETLELQVAARAHTPDRSPGSAHAARTARRRGRERLEPCAAEPIQESSLRCQRQQSWQSASAMPP